LPRMYAVRRQSPLARTRLGVSTVDSATIDSLETVRVSAFITTSLIEDFGISAESALDPFLCLSCFRLVH
jgi:hypothetical protein